MKSSCHSLIILVLILICACAQNKPLGEVDGKIRFDKVFNAISHLDTMRIDRPLLVSYALVANNEFLFSLTDKSDPVVRVFDHRTGRYLGGFGKNGEGPGEFERINRSGFTRNGKNIVITTIKYIRSYEVKVEMGEFKFRMLNEGKLPGELTPLNNAFLLNDSIVAGKRMLSDSYFSTFNVNSGEISGYGEYPNLEPEIPKASYHHLYQSQSQLRPDGKKLAGAFTNFPLLRIRDIETNSVQDLFVSPKNEQKKVEAAPDGRSIQSFDLYKYFNKIEVNQSYILVKYGEREIVPKAPGSREWVSNQLVDQTIMVFDWEGKPIVKLRIDDWMKQFTLTPDNRVILFHPEEKDELYVIDLKKLIE